MVVIYNHSDLQEGEHESYRLPSLEDSLHYVPTVFVKTVLALEGNEDTLHQIIEEEASKKGYVAVFISSFYLEKSDVIENIENKDRFRAVCTGYKVSKKMDFNR